MKLYYLFFIGIFFLIGNSVLAKDRTNTQSLSLQWGTAFLSQQDLVLSPMIHKDLAWSALTIQYARQKKWSHQFKLDYLGFQYHPKHSSYILDAELQDFYPHTGMTIDIEYTTGKVLNPESNFPTVVGMAVINELQSKNYSYGRISSFGYFLHFGVGVFAQQQWKWSNRHHLSVYAHVPLLSWTARSPFAVNDDEFIENISSHSGFKTMMSFIRDGQFQTIAGVQNMDARLKYFWQASEKWSIGGEYAFEFWRQAEPRSFIHYQQNLQCIVQFHF